ncbi:hypothetical protein IQ06DRAFT_345892 [Phaeosphaeriaceae sp. SRC1lsM3a]|nr:hypothetical protein IQ06DRAFT_345892 [Stagonospora sp. SRC1lsM3a]
MGQFNPREDWPSDVPYLNCIAFYERERKLATEKKNARNARQEQKKVAKEAKAKADEARASETHIPYDDPQALAELMQELEHQNSQREKQSEFLRRSKIDPVLVSYEKWLDAVQGTDALQTDSTVPRYVKLARRRRIGEECNGWVRGSYFGTEDALRRQG